MAATVGWSGGAGVAVMGSAVIPGEDGVREFRDWRRAGYAVRRGGRLRAGSSVRRVVWLQRGLRRRLVRALGSRLQRGLRRRLVRALGSRLQRGLRRRLVRALGGRLRPRRRLVPGVRAPVERRESIWLRGGLRRGGRLRELGVTSGVNAERVSSAMDSSPDDGGSTGSVCVSSASARAGTSRATREGGPGRPSRGARRTTGMDRSSR